MVDQVEATVNYVCSFLYGCIPRSRVDMFAVELANGLMERRDEEMKELIVAAAETVSLKVEDVLKLLPEEIDRQSKGDSELGDKRAPLVYSPSTGCYSTRSFLPTWTTRDFCATRFGTTKLKTLPNEMTGKEEPRLMHSYTSPSPVAYLQLLVHLNLIAWGHLLHEEETSEQIQTE